MFASATASLETLFSKAARQQPGPCPNGSKKLSKKGLQNRDILNKNGKNETLFLNHLQKVIDNKLTNADHMISKFSKTEDLSELYDK